MSQWYNGRSRTMHKSFTSKQILHAPKIFLGHCRKFYMRYMIGSIRIIVVRNPDFHHSIPHTPPVKTHFTHAGTNQPTSCPLKPNLCARIIFKHPPEEWQDPLEWWRARCTSCLGRLPSPSQTRVGKEGEQEHDSIFPLKSDKESLPALKAQFFKNIVHMAVDEPPPPCFEHVCYNFLKSFKKCVKVCCNKIMWKSI